MECELYLKPEVIIQKLLFKVCVSHQRNEEKIKASKSICPVAVDPFEDAPYPKTLKDSKRFE